MKKNYQKPIINVENINLDDVIAASTDPIKGGFDGFGDWKDNIFED